MLNAIIFALEQTACDQAKGFEDGLYPDCACAEGSVVAASGQECVAASECAATTTYPDAGKTYCRDE